MQKFGDRKGLIFSRKTEHPAIFELQLFVQNHYNLESTLTLRFLTEPTDVNFGGKVHGGMVMKWIDQAGFACASNWCSGYCVTVYVGGIRFFQPIHIGDLVEIQCRIIYTGNTSMHVAVDVYSRATTEITLRKNTHCIIVFVAVDEAGNPRPVPNWKPTNEQERQLERYAKKLMDLRKDIDEEMRPFLEEQ